MELKEFIAQTLVQIQEGVEDAIKARHAGLGYGVINPVFGEDPNAIGMDNVQQVEFDVAVIVNDTKSGGGKAGIKVFAVQLGADGSATSERSTVSRIKFSVPIIPPVQVVKPSPTSRGQAATDYDLYPER